MFYTFSRFILGVFFKICLRLKAFGRENFPLEGPLIVASNHASFFDPIIIGIGAPRKLNYLARDTLFRFKPFAKILYLVNTFPLKREGSDINAFRISLSKLSEGKAVLIFPEGTRSQDGNLQKPKYGIGFLAARSGAQILPCYVKGSMEALPRHLKLPKLRPVSVHFGKPLNLDKDFLGDKRQLYAHVAEEVMAAIRELKKNADAVASEAPPFARKGRGEAKQSQI